MIIDCHCHAGQGDGFTGPWDTDAPLGAYLRRAARAGIERTVLLPAFHSDYAVANRALARIVARQPQRFIGFAIVHAARDRGRVLPMLRSAIERDGLAGIKLHRHDAPITREVCDAARALRVPVLYDVMGEVSVVELLAEQYPDVALHHPAPRQLRRRLARPARADRPPRAPSERVHRHLRRAPLRPARAGGAARRRAQDPVRLRRSVAAPGAGAGEDALAGPRARRRGARARRQPAASDRATAGQALPWCRPPQCDERCLRPPQLQRAIGDPQRGGRAVHVAVLLVRARPGSRNRWQAGRSPSIPGPG